ncbi:MAG TPA: hypothetical protein VLB82_13465 [Thermodesulfobacteriota bacterium]|nr:hypothetical protein [Thermodesulfobacteriota bacterium]
MNDQYKKEKPEQPVEGVKKEEKPKQPPVQVSSKQSEKQKPKKEVNPLERHAKLIEMSDDALLVTSKHGNIEVTAVKGLNYAYQAKGLLNGALDMYLIRPTTKVLRDVSDANMKLSERTFMEIKKSLDELVNQLNKAIGEDTPEGENNDKEEQKEN